MANFLRFHSCTALSNKGMLNRFDDELLVNIPVKNLKSAWQQRYTGEVELPSWFTMIPLFVVTVVSPFYICSSIYGKVLTLLSCISFLFLTLRYKKITESVSANVAESIAVLFFSHFSMTFFMDFLNKWVNFILGCLFAAMHTYLILNMYLSNSLKTLYLLFFYVLFISFTFLGTGLLYFILTPQSLRYLLKNDEVKPQDPIPPTERYTDPPDYTYEMVA